MDQIATVLKQELNKYVTVGFKGRTELTSNQSETVFTLVTYGQIKGERFTFTSIIVSLMDETIIIEVDKNSKPLVDALVQAGIPREQIILAYIGEKVPETLI
ncbi:MAG: element excision factor XisI family protein [Chloroflexota bacterium]